MKETNLQVRLLPAHDWGRYYPLAVIERGLDGGIAAFAQPLTIQRVPEQGEQYIDPTLLKLDQTQCQVLMDDLWKAGIRPTEGSGSAGSLAATERHLEDMRAIVGKQLDVPFGGQKVAPGIATTARSQS